MKNKATATDYYASKLILSFWKEFDMPVSQDSIEFIRQLNKSNNDDISWWQKTSIRRQWLKDIQSIAEVPTYETVMTVRNCIDSANDEMLAAYSPEKPYHQDKYPIPVGY